MCFWKEQLIVSSSVWCKVIGNEWAKSLVSVLENLPLPPVVQRMEIAIQRIIHYPAASKVLATPTKLSKVNIA